MSNDKPAAGGTAEVRRPADSAERAYAVIRKQLTELRIRPEERINEMQLARDLELSRTPIREALNRLASEGFIVPAPNRGFYFRGLDIGDLLDLFEMRTIVETGAFALLCERVDDAGLDRLAETWRMSKVRYEDRDADEILDLDEAFHLLLAELSGNPEIVRQLGGLNARIRFVRRMQIQYSPENRNKDLRRDHDAIVEAARSRDAARGIAVLKDHISMTVAEARSALKEALLHAFVDANPGGKG